MLMFYNLVETKVPDIPAEFSAEEVQKIKDSYIELGFTTPKFLDVIARQTLENSATKIENEVYAWGDIVRREDERINKRTIALIPLAIGAGVGAAAVSKATPGGLVSIVVGCLQQRLALALHGVKSEDYYG